MSVRLCVCMSVHPYVPPSVSIMVRPPEYIWWLSWEVSICPPELVCVGAPLFLCVTIMKMRIFSSQSRLIINNPGIYCLIWYPQHPQYPPTTSYPINQASPCTELPALSRPRHHTLSLLRLGHFVHSLVNLASRKRDAGAILRLPRHHENRSLGK